jgi:hypothetical protein
LEKLKSWRFNWVLPGHGWTPTKCAASSLRWCSG